MGEESEQNGATFIFEFNKSSIDVVPFICEDQEIFPNNSKFCFQINDDILFVPLLFLSLSRVVDGGVISELSQHALLGITIKTNISEFKQLHCHSNYL